MKLYYTDGKEVVNNTIHLGMVKIGESKEYTYILKNDSAHDYIEIQVSLDDSKGYVGSDEINIFLYPEKLKVREESEIKFTWTPTFEIKSGLKTKLIIRAFEVWR